MCGSFSAKPNQRRVLPSRTTWCLAGLATDSGRRSLHDYHYQYDRIGTAALFLLSAPLLDWRAVKVRDRRTAVDCAHVQLVDVHFPEAEKIVPVCDNLNTHTPSPSTKLWEDRQAPSSQAGVAQHPTPRQLAQPGQVRTKRPGTPMPPLSFRRAASPGCRDGCLVPLPQPEAQSRPLVLHDRRHPHPAASVVTRQANPGSLTRPGHHVPLATRTE